MNIGYNGQDETALITSPRPSHADRSRATVPIDKPTPTLTPQQVEEFWALVRVDMYDADACWPWTGAFDSSGYGSFRWAMRPNRRTMAHRIAFILQRGDVPAGLELDHLCRNRDCCNPAHLEAVTHGENIRRSGPATKTHCKHGHEFTPSNTRMRRGHRECRACIKRSLADQWTRGSRKRGANG